MATFDIAGHDVNLSIPDDAVVTGAVIIATYQRLNAEGVGAGTVWGHSSIPNVHAVGMVRLAQQAIENQAWSG